KNDLLILIQKHVLVNAIEHDGKAQVQAVLGKVIAERPELKIKIKKIIPEVRRMVKRINSLSLKSQEIQLKKLGVEIRKERVKEKMELPELPNAEAGNVVMRLAPFPSGPLHIGNARMIILNDEYVKKYKGKLLLIIDDTIGSEEKFILPEAYDLILDGLKWLGVKYHKVLYKSDRLNLFYNFIKELIKKKFAYVCECDVKTLRKNRAEGIVCNHRQQDTEENLEKWSLMLKGKYKEGEAIVRLKTDMKHPNPAFRDRVLARIVERKHPRVGKKYVCWPLLEASWALDDHLLGITHIIRGKDLMIEDMMEEFIWDAMGWKKSNIVHYGTLNLEGLKLSKTEARKSIEKKVYTGWEDPRTWSLQSLRKRGIQPEAIRKFIFNLGLSLADITVPTEILYAENRKIIDPLANRYFAVLDPVKISVKNPPKIKETEVPFHPDFPEKGKRKIPVDVEKIYVERDDLKKYENEEIGLINLFSIRLREKAEFISEKIKFEVQKIHWVSEPNVKIKIVMPDGSTREALAEPEIKNVKVDQLTQLQRIGFCRVDSMAPELVLYFSHK
ncbi:MAG: glutamate--tRNA ligase, partial [Candidatus Aenigmarchaeota archaeon]|nr:glutamate--tRNA ligase [Candidatus Aenigmarchaeota archaeon]